jgi:predicted secreted protein
MRLIKCLIRLIKCRIRLISVELVGFCGIVGNSKSHYKFKHKYYIEFFYFGKRISRLAIIFYNFLNSGNLWSPELQLLMQQIKEGSKESNLV